MIRKLIQAIAFERTAVSGSTSTPAVMLSGGIHETGAPPVGPISSILPVSVYPVNSFRTNKEVESKAATKLVSTATVFLACPPALEARTERAPPAMGTIQIRLGMRYA